MAWNKTALAQSIQEAARAVLGSTKVSALVSALAEGVASGVLKHPAALTVESNVVVTTDGLGSTQSGIAKVTDGNSWTPVSLTTMPDSNYLVVLTHASHPNGRTPYVTFRTPTGFRITLDASTVGADLDIVWLAYYPNAAKGKGIGQGRLV